MAENKRVILLAPHNDDEALFASYICIREKPLVVIVTDSWKQFNRGDGITYEQRREETLEAMKILGCEVLFLGIRDDGLNKENLLDALNQFNPDLVYAPAIQGGNKHHDLIGSVARECFDDVVYYSTYSKKSLYTTGDIEIKPTEEEVRLKNLALDCYKSQIAYYRTAPHFTAVRDKSEWVSMPKLNIIQKMWDKLFSHNAVSLKNVTAVVITKLPEYPKEIKLSGFGEVIIKTNSPSVYERYLQAKKAKNDIIYVQDDDCIVDYKKLFKYYNGRITNSMNSRRKFYNEISGGRITLVGWGTFFPKNMLASFDKYIEKYGVDHHLLVDADRIFTWLNYPHNTIKMDHIDLPEASSKDRMSSVEKHWQNLKETIIKLKNL